MTRVRCIANLLESSLETGIVIKDGVFMSYVSVKNTWPGIAEAS